MDVLDARQMVVLFVGGGIGMLNQSTNPRSRLTADDVVSVRIAVKLGIRVRHIARVTKLPVMTVSDIARGVCHAYVWSDRLSPYEDC